MRILADLLFPPKCPACGELLPYRGFFGAKEEKSSALCAECTSLWKKEKEELCGICGESVANCLCATKTMQSAGCNCFCKLVYYRPGNKEEVGNRIVYRIKDHNERAAVLFLAQELSREIRKCMGRETWKGKSFFLCYLPRRSRAVLEGGSDQAKELAVELAKRLELPFLPLIGRRQKSQTPQKFLTVSGRLSNATEAFYLVEKRKDEAAGKVAILVDDIVTSGASMTAGIRLLRRAGASDFLAVAVASDECNKNPKIKAPETRSEYDRIYERLIHMRK
ncbi:MAG: ComF family protein [Ruminococcaceae bacterium]|nr:ComF family protein [Oscillospiraceae bacterium]